MKRRNFIKLLTSALTVPAIAKADVSIPSDVIEQLPESSDIETVGRIVLPEKKIYNGGVIDLGEVYHCAAEKTSSPSCYIDVLVEFDNVLFGKLKSEFDCVISESVYSLTHGRHKVIANAQCIRLRPSRDGYGRPAIDLGLIANQTPTVIYPEL